MVFDEHHEKVDVKNGKDRVLVGNGSFQKLNRSAGWIKESRAFTIQLGRTESDVFLLSPIIWRCLEALCPAYPIALVALVMHNNLAAGHGGILEVMGLT